MFAVSLVSHPRGTVTANLFAQLTLCATRPSAVSSNLPRAALDLRKNVKKNKNTMHTKLQANPAQAPSVSGFAECEHTTQTPEKEM
jgi:hypothetical protein